MFYPKAAVCPVRMIARFLFVVSLLMGSSVACLSSDITVRSCDLHSSYPETDRLLNQPPLRSATGESTEIPYMLCGILTEEEAQKYRSHSNDKEGQESSATTLPNGAECTVTLLPSELEEGIFKVRIDIKGPENIDMSAECVVASGQGIILRSETSGDPNGGRLLLLQIRKKP